MAYIAAVAAHPAFTSRFKSDLVKPGLRIPLTADAETFQCCGRSRADRHLASHIRRAICGPRRVTAGAATAAPIGTCTPRIPAAGAISTDPAAMPDTIDYDETNHRLLIGSRVRGRRNSPGVELRGLRQAGAAAVVQLSQGQPRAADHWRSAAAIEIG